MRTGALTVVPGIFKFTTLGHIPNLVDASGVCSVTALLQSEVFLMIPETVTVSKGRILTDFHVVFTVQTDS